MINRIRYRINTSFNRVAARPMNRAAKRDEDKDSGRDLGRDENARADRDGRREEGRRPGKDRHKEEGRKDAGRDRNREEGHRDAGRDRYKEESRKDAGKDRNRGEGRRLGKIENREPAKRLGKEEGRAFGRRPGKEEGHAFGRRPGKEEGRSFGKHLGKARLEEETAVLSGERGDGTAKSGEDITGLKEAMPSGSMENGAAHALSAEMQADSIGHADGEDGEDSASSYIEGRNAILEAFRSGRTIDKLFVLEGCKDGPIQAILNEAKKQGTVIHFVGKERLNYMSGTKKHQGAIAVSAAYEYVTVDDILARAEEKGEPAFLILLDNIEDPHNLGAIIRTANLAGVHGIIIPKRRAVGLTGTVVKASAGALNFTPVAKVTNLNQTIQDLKKRGIWFVCADMEGDVMYRQDLTGPIGLVIGSEGEGVSRLVKENCDFISSIPMKGEIGSLNASAAAAVLAYEIVRQRGSF